MKLIHQNMMLVVMASLVSHATWAIPSGNSVGKISGRQIEMVGVPTLSGNGGTGTSLTAVVPGVMDLDNDQLVDWRYQWKLDGTAVATEALAGSVDVIPPYQVQAVDAGQTITLCLKAVADKGYPTATQQSDEGCSSGVVATNSGYLEAQPAGTFIKGDEVRRNWSSANIYCSDLVSDGFSDWRLPTMGELQTLYNAYPSNSLSSTYGWVTTIPYWSSSDDGSSVHIGVYLDSSNVAGLGDYATLEVTCVR